MPNAITDSNRITKIFDRLYTSGMAPLRAIDPDALNKFGIIVSITENAVSSLREFTNENDIEYRHFTSKDSTRSRIGRLFNPIYDILLSHYISGRTTGKNILIHSENGISRPTTILIAFLLKYLSEYCETVDANINNTDLLLHNVQLRRAAAQPNTGFMNALYKYEGELF